MIAETWSGGSDPALAVALSGTPQRIDRTGRMRAARRSIDPPVLEFTPVAGAAGYELLVKPSEGDGEGWRLRADSPSFDLTEIWGRVPFGRFRFTPLARDVEGRVNGAGAASNFVRSPDWADEEKPLLDWRGAALGVARHMLVDAPKASEHPEDPAYMWHAAATVDAPLIFHPLQFPALCYASFIRLFVAVAGQDDAALPMARKLCDYLIEHPVIDRGPLAGAPKSTMDSAGAGAMWEADSITAVRVGFVGGAALELAQATHDPRYRDYAIRLAGVLLELQREDGSFPYRVRLEDGAAVEPYTAASVIALRLFEQLLDGAEGELCEALESGLDRGTAWLLENPVRTGLWQQMYEDVTTREPYENLEQWAALETAMLLLRRGHDAALDIAKRLVRYVEDQFVIFGREPSITPVPYVPLTPAAIEQYVCYWPMDFHTANYARATLAMHEATGDPTWLHKAMGAVNTIVGCRLPDGRFSTVVPDRDLRSTPRFHAWYNCMSHAAYVLLEIGPRLQQLGAQ